MLSSWGRGSAKPLDACGRTVPPPQELGAARHFGDLQRRLRVVERRGEAGRQAPQALALCHLQPRQRPLHRLQAQPTLSAHHCFPPKDASQAQAAVAQLGAATQGSLRFSRQLFEAPPHHALLGHEMNTRHW
jgi:hypothetical protein